jgi:hypothetical protein
MSRIVASGVDFFVGITAVEDVLGVALGLVLLAAGDEDWVGEGEVAALGVGEVFSVVTDTLGSSAFSEAVASGEAAGEGLSSWARANGVAAAKRAIMATSVIFIWFSCGWNWAQARPEWFEARIVVSASILRQGSIAVQNRLATIVL